MVRAIGLACWRTLAAKMEVIFRGVADGPFAHIRFDVGHRRKVTAIKYDG